MDVLSARIQRGTELLVEECARRLASEIPQDDRDCQTRLDDRIKAYADLDTGTMGADAANKLRRGRFVPLLFALENLIVAVERAGERTLAQKLKLCEAQLPGVANFLQGTYDHMPLEKKIRLACQVDRVAEEILETLRL